MVRFYYDPLHGYLPVLASEDENGKQRKKFTYSTYYGYVPVSTFIKLFFRY
jgi:hypothetical protein